MKEGETVGSSDKSVFKWAESEGENSQFIFFKLGFD